MGFSTTRLAGGATVFLAAILFLVEPAPLRAQEASEAVDPALFGDLEWRNVGANRGGRSIAVVGTPARPLE